MNPDRKGGRPRKNPISTEGDTSRRGKRGDFVLPLLPHGRNCTIEETAAWAHALTEEQLKHAVFYFYRTWPAWDAKKFDPPGGPESPTNIKIVAGPWPYSAENFEQDFMAEFGSGDYYVSINEDGTHRWKVYWKTTRDFTNYPPVLDHRLLILDDPANKSYIAWARAHGRLNDIDLPETENDMASNAALERMADTTDRLTDKVIDLADRATQRPEATSVESQVQLKIVEQMNEASTKAIDTVISIMDRQAANKDRQSDPMEMVDRIVALTGSLNKGDGQVVSLMQQMIDSERKRNERLEDRLNNIEQRRNGGDGEGGDGQAGGLLAQLRGLGEIKSVLTDLGIIKPPDEGSSAEQSGGESKSGSLKGMMLEMAIREVPKVLPQLIGAGGLVGLLESGTRLFQAARGQQVANLSPRPATDTSAPAVAAPAAPVMLNGFPAPTATGQQMIDDAMNFVWQITPTLLYHMDAEDRDGYSFARAIIERNQNGRRDYNFMKDAGLDPVKELVQAYTPLWSIISREPGAASRIAKFDEFLKEALRLDEWEKEQEEMEDQQGDEVEEAAAPMKTAKAGK